MKEAPGLNILILSREYAVVAVAKINVYVLNCYRSVIDKSLRLLRKPKEYYGH